MSEENKETQEEIKLPTLDKGCKVLYDNNEGNLWIGIPVRKTDPMTAFAWLGACQLEFMKAYQRELPAIMQDAQKNRQPTTLKEKLRDGVGSMMSRLSGR